MPKIKAVIDTNVFVKALIGSITNEKVYNTFEDGLFDLILSKRILEEIVDVLSRPKIGINLEDLKETLHLIKKKAKIIEVTTKIDACRDSSDNIILEAAISAKADIIVTNDKDLLVLNPFRNIPIIPPSEFLKILK